MTVIAHEIRDISLAPIGKKKILWAYRNMPVLRSIEKEITLIKPLAGLRIAVSVHVEAKTACLARALRSAGADVYLTGCNPLSTQDDVAAALAADGIHVYAIHGVDAETYTKHLIMALTCHPHVIIDDGGDLAMLLHSSHKDLMDCLMGGCEETTTGVHRLRILEKEGRLAFPSIAVNDARCKHLFDNRFGTGQSVWTAIMTTTNLLISGKTVVVAGFGMCGKGVALRAKGLGARVIVTEIDTVKACEALMEGYDVMKMAEAASLGDFFITVTGCKDVITKEHFIKMKDGAICCNAGHFDVEVNLKDLASLSKSKSILRNGIEGYLLEDGRTICILAEGRLVNLASGDGHPAEIMDMSFSLQLLSSQYLAQNRMSMKNIVYNIPAEIDDKVAGMLLEHKNRQIEVLTPDQEKYLYSWDIEGV